MHMMHLVFKPPSFLCCLDVVFMTSHLIRQIIHQIRHMITSCVFEKNSNIVIPLSTTHYI